MGSIAGINQIFISRGSYVETITSVLAGSNILNDHGTFMTGVILHLTNWLFASAPSPANVGKVLRNLAERRLSHLKDYVFVPESGTKQATQIIEEIVLKCVGVAAMSLRRFADVVIKGKGP